MANDDDLRAEMRCIEAMRQDIARQEQFARNLLESVQRRCRHPEWTEAHFDEWSGQWWLCTLCGIRKQGNGETGPVRPAAGP